MVNKKQKSSLPDKFKQYFIISKPEGKMATMKAVLLLSYNISNYKDFENIKFKQVKDVTLLKRLKSNLFYLDYIDPKSQLYNSLYSICKKTLEQELQPKKYEYLYSYLLDYFCEMCLKDIVGKISKKVRYFPEKTFTTDQLNETEEVSEEIKFIVSTKNEIIVNPRYTGKQLLRDKEKFKDFKENLNL